MVYLSYEKYFNEKQIPTKAIPIQMNPELLEYCKNEINDLLSKKLVRPSHYPWKLCNLLCTKDFINRERHSRIGYQLQTFE